MSEGAPQGPFSEARRLAWLRLWRSENVGPRTFQTLLERYGSAEAALEALPAILKRTSGGRAVKIAEPGEVERELAAAERIGGRFICRGEPDFPALLGEIADPPAVICVRGRTTVLQRPAIAIVGARNASAAGLAFAERMARGLAQAGYVIVSGFARGIDSRAHRASLTTGTIAVLAGGHDRLYPADQMPFLEQILEEGAALSEMPLEWEARGRDFPRRNRLVSGMVLGVIIVEAARRSGSLITARFAADQGREVFAVPGSPLDPRAEGTNDLIRDGATFCTSVDDVIQALTDRPDVRAPKDLLADSPPSQPTPLWDELVLDETDLESAILARSNLPVPDSYQPEDPKDLAADNASHERATVDCVVERLGPSPVSIDELARAVDRPIRDVRSAVLELEIAGRVERHGGGLVSLIMT